MKQLAKFILATFGVLVLAACSSKRYITPEDLHQRLENNEPTLVIDTRSSFEFNNAHIKDAKHIPFWKAAFVNEDTLECEGKLVVIHCAHGPRAGIGRFFLEGEHCPEMYYLKGHFSAWIKAKLPTQTNSE